MICDKQLIVKLIRYPEENAVPDPEDSSDHSDNDDDFYPYVLVGERPQQKGHTKPFSRGGTINYKEILDQTENLPVYDKVTHYLNSCAADPYEFNEESVFSQKVSQGNGLSEAVPNKEEVQFSDEFGANSSSSTSVCSASEHSAYEPPGGFTNCASGNETTTEEGSIVIPIAKDLSKVTGESLKDFCPFCFEPVGHFTRHLSRKHSEEEAVQKINEMPLKSKTRRDAVIVLRKKGNYILKEQLNEIKPVRKPASMGAADIPLDENYFACIYCLGYYKKSYLWRHKKICKSNITHNDAQEPSRVRHLSESQTFAAATGILGNYLSKTRLRQEVLNIMKADKISSVAKSDPLICLYGESLLNRHKRKQMSNVVSNKMRELSRLKIALKQFTAKPFLLEMLKPEMYDYFVTASKIISGYDEDKKTFKASSLALHMGTNLKFLCDIARKALITKNSLFGAVQNVKDVLKEILKLRELIVGHWCNDIGSLANKVLVENNANKPKLLPLTKDVHQFNNYVTSAAEMAYSELLRKKDLSKNYKLLAEATLAIILIFNRKRIGEVQFLDIASYKRNVSSVNQEECLDSLTPLEKNMSGLFKRVIVFGKGSKPVPILFTKKMQTYTDLLIHLRETTNIVPRSNKYVFANPNSADHWINGSAVISKFAQKCGAQRPDLLTSTRFRKQIATILQIMNFEQHEMEQIARFMGHTEKTHHEFYRLSDDVYQTAKVAKVLLLLNAGKGTEFKGKSLNEIEVTEEVVFEPNANTLLLPTEVEEPDLEYRDEVVEKLDNTDSSSKRINHIEKGKGRHRWTEKQKGVVLQHFKNHIKNSIPPKKNECLKLISENPDLFKGVDWVRMKTYIYNTYRNK